MDRETAPAAIPADIREELEQLMMGSVDVLPEGMLLRQLVQARADDRPLRVKLGVDPTAPDIHLGHTVVLRKLRQFQDFGHTAVLIIGDYTGKVGDPSGRSKSRPQLSDELLEANARTYVDQAAKVLDMDKVELTHNGDWLAPLRMNDVLKLTSLVTVARMLERDDFSKRYTANEPISMLEFMYPLLQGYDSVAVRADIELGGPTRSSTCSWAAPSWRATGSRRRASSPYRCWSVPTASRRCPSHTATMWGSATSLGTCSAR